MSADLVIREGEPLAPRTTLGIGGAAQTLIEVSDAEGVQTAIAYARDRGLPLAVLGAGSNLLVPDEGVRGVVLQITAADIAIAGDGTLTADAGARWNDVVDAAVRAGWWGIENLAGVPGSMGGATVQNIGAYGGELSRAFLYVETIDKVTGETRRVERADAAFGYRTSFFKKQPNLIITKVALTLARESAPNLTYPDLVRAHENGVALTTPAEIADAVRAIRAAKFPRTKDEGTAGSFFKNPVIPLAQAHELSARYPGLPVYPQEDGTAKVLLAWILDRVLGLKGYARGHVRLFEGQPLILVATRGATARDVSTFADDVVARVHDATGITIEREVETFGV